MSKNCKKKQGLSAGLLAVILGVIFFIGGGYSAMAVSSHEGSATTASLQQTLAINGTVVDSQNEPVIGATVMEKGTTNGTATNVDGKFSLNVQPNATLVITYLGYKSQEVKAGQDLWIVLVEDSQYLDELIVIGYGVQKKKLVTGATVHVTSEDISKLNTTSVLGALQSQAPGVNITQVSGFIGDGFKVNIRGLGTNGNAAPLYVIDGIAGGDINALSPSDIESIDVLKDAATAAIYGSRGANGIIIVTTKRGTANSSSISYEGYYGVQNLYKIPTILTAQEFMTIQDIGRVFDGFDPYNWSNFIPAGDLAAINDGSWKGTNWLKEILNKNAPIQSHSINIQNGGERSLSSIGLTFLQQEATMGVPTDIPVMNRFNLRVNTSSTLIKKGALDVLKFGETLNYRYNNQKGSVARDDIYWNAVHDMIIMSPLMRPYNAKGEYYTYPDQLRDGYNWDMANNANKNPIANLDYRMSQNLTKSHSLQGSLWAELRPIKDLTIRSDFGYRMNASSYRSYQPTFQLTASLQRTVDLVSQSMSLSSFWSWDNTATYIWKNDKHNFDFLIGHNISRYMWGETISGSKEGSSFYDFEHAYLSNVPGINTTTGLSGGPTWPIANGRASVFGRVNYNYNEKYMTTVIFRADGSSYFAPGHRWSYFPSISAGWIISNEEFWGDLVKGIDFLKLRASYGQNGNDLVDTFQYFGLIRTDNSTTTEYIGTGGYPFGDSMGDAAIGSYRYRGVNPDLKWEWNEMVNLGFDARFLANRLGLEFDWYNRITRDWLVIPPAILSLGVFNAADNGGDVKNTGFETVLSWNDHTGRDFNYGLNLSLGHNVNKVLKIANEEGIIKGPPHVLYWGLEECARVGEVGKPFGYFYGYKTLGVFQTQEEINNYQGPLLLGKNTRPGDIIWYDANGDGEITPDDRTDIGNPHPKFTMGFSFNVGYKGIELSVTTYGAFGHQILKCYRDYMASPMGNYTTDIFTAWQGEGTSNRLPRMTSSAHSNWSNFSDLYIENGDYLKIKNIQLGYDLKRAFTKLPVQQLKVYINAQNLFTFTGYSGMDPEIGYGAGYNTLQGIDLGFYPSARVFMVGANIKF